MKPHGIFRSEETKNRCGDPKTVSDTIPIATDEDGDNCGKSEEAKLPGGGNPLFGIGIKSLHPGRIANFVNDELWGRTTDVPWGFIVTSPEASRVCEELIKPCVRHPSQIYEAILEGLILFLIMLYLTFRKKALQFPGRLAGVFFIGYGSARCFVELFRQPDAQFQSLNNPLGFFIQMGEFGLTMGQILSIPMIIIGFILYFTSGRRKAV